MRYTGVTISLLDFYCNRYFLTPRIAFFNRSDGRCSARRRVRGRAAHRLSVASSVLDQGELDRDFEPRARRAVAQPERAAVTAHEALHDRHAETRSIGLGARGIDAVERAGDEADLVLRNAGPLVEYRQLHTRMGDARLQHDVRNAVGFAQTVLLGILEQIADHAPQIRFIPFDEGRIG